MAALCASIGRLLARCSGTLEKLSASERRMIATTASPLSGRLGAGFVRGAAAARGATA
jgi:hypothetical protein